MHGFSLIEILVVMTIMLILTVTALPTYDRYLRRFHRLEAKAELLKKQAEYEAYFANHQAYPLSNTRLYFSTTSQSYYHYTSVTTPTTYTITATAIDKQTMDSAGTVSCRVLTVDNMGQYMPTVCWDK